MNQIKADWQAILEEVKLANHSIRAFLQAGEPTHLDQNGALMITYRYNFHKERMDEIRNRTVVEKAIEKITGLKVHLCGEVDADKLLKTNNSRNITAQHSQDEASADITAVFGGGKIIDNC